MTPDNNTMRHQYRVLTDAEKVVVQKIKDLGLALHNECAQLEPSHAVTTAQTRAAEAVMWAFKAITG